MGRRLVLSELSWVMWVLLSELLVIGGVILIAVQWPLVALPVWEPVIRKREMWIDLGDRLVNIFGLGRPCL
jgi:hypothetical protein